MSHRFKLLLTCLICLSVVPQALAGVIPQTTLLTENDRVKSDRTFASVKGVLKYISPGRLVAASPAAASATPLPVASPTVTLSPTPTAPSRNASALPDWLWWGAIGLLPIAVVVGVIFILQTKERKQPSVKQKAKNAFQPVIASSGTLEQKAQGNSKNEQPDETSPDTQSNTSQSIAPDQANLPASPNLPVSTTTRLAKVDIVVGLIHDLHHVDSNQRRKAIWELGQRGDSRAIQPLVELLIDSDSNQRGLILAAVTEISIRALKPINRALLLSVQDGSPDVRKNAIRDATRIFELVTQTNQLLQYAATSDADADVQLTAEWALGQLNRVRPALTADGASNLASKNNSSVDLPSLIENPNVEIARQALEQTEVSKG